MQERHKRILIKQNPLWEKKKFAVPEFKRDEFGIIADYIRYKQIIAIVGLRRVGKTVLLKQIIKQLSTHVNERNICYISFDDRDFQKYEMAEDLINYFLELSNTGKKRYLFLDEIQKVPNWNDLLKTVYEIEENLKIVVSGSSAMELKRYKETLAGRILTFHLPVFSFREFLRYMKQEYEIGFNHDPEIDFNEIKFNEINFKHLFREYDLKFLTKKERYLELFNTYLIKGAFPELLDIDDEEFIRRYLRESVINKVVADLSKQIDPNREDIAYELLRIFSKNTAGLFEMVTLSNTLNVNRNIVSNYVGLLEKSFLIKISYNYTKSVIKKARLSKKAYIAHPSIPISLLDYPVDIIQMEGYDMGHLVESVIVNHLEKTSFWRTPQKDEVDIVIKRNNEVIPIEIKYKNQITKKDLKGIVKFMKKFKVKRGIIVTKDVLKEENDILYMPAWLFLLAIPAS